MDMSKLGPWVNEHKPLVIGGGIVGAVGLGLLLRASGRGSSGAQSQTLAAATPTAAGSATAGPDLSYIDASLNDLYSQQGSLYDTFQGLYGDLQGQIDKLGTAPKVAPTVPVDSSPVKATPITVTPTINVVPGVKAPDAVSSPLALSPFADIGSGQVVGGTWITNPASSIAPTDFYTPSVLDILSTVTPVGQQVVTLPGSDPSRGLTYTVFNQQVGSGAPVPPSARIPGERYDPSGRVIL